ncbi:family 43 glycosylhydrolase [Paenarthrobacter aromaticivorans]|uniref:family 43 glycosylhydrolase n=1 Tax=Paenarthrobacter aromaticivorans TaxID=2849150 RepID=UPI003A7F77FD
MAPYQYAERGKISPGKLFLDQDGNVAQLHGAGIQQFDGVYFAWGEDKRNGGTFGGVACYSSPDLASWTFRGQSLPVMEDVPELAADRVVERPKVLRNSEGNYVMFLHVDSRDYSDAKVGWAIAGQPEGPYEFIRAERPLGNVSRDIGVFADDDGTGFLLSEDREHGLQIYRLSDDYLSVDRLVSTTLAPESDHPLGAHGYESPAMVKVAGLYYLFGSDLTGWSTNDNKYATAQTPAGPWSEWQDFAPSGSATYDSQVSTIVSFAGTHGTGHVYVGDRWIRDDLFHSAPVWLPIHISGGKASLEWADEWVVDSGGAITA